MDMASPPDGGLPRDPRSNPPAWPGQARTPDAVSRLRAGCKGDRSKAIELVDRVPQ